MRGCPNLTLFVMSLAVSQPLPFVPASIFRTRIFALCTPPASDLRSPLGLSAHDPTDFGVTDVRGFPGNGSWRALSSSGQTICCQRSAVPHTNHCLQISLALLKRLKQYSLLGWITSPPLFIFASIHLPLAHEHGRLVGCEDHRI